MSSNVNSGLCWFFFFRVFSPPPASVPTFLWEMLLSLSGVTAWLCAGHGHAVPVPITAGKEGVNCTRTAGERWRRRGSAEGVRRSCSCDVFMVFSLSLSSLPMQKPGMDVADAYVTFVRHSQDVLRDKVNEEMYIERLFDVSKCLLLLGHQAGETQNVTK